ncbi:response regulator [bacterium]|nr:response regulator [candidate division CSSED10-310 bacterium]
MANILIADDNEFSKQVLIDILEIDGHNVFAASDGKEAVLIYEREEIDLIITDIAMPAMNGLELITQIKKFNPAAKIIAMTGGDSAPVNSLSVAKEMGASYTLMKPFKPVQILDAVSLLLNSKA